MKILFLSNRLPHKNVAGGHRMVYHRIRQLALAGHQVGLASFVAPGQEVHIPSLCKTVHDLRTVPQPRHGYAVRLFRDYMSMHMPAIFWKNYSPVMMRTIGDMVEQTEYDVVVAEFSEMGMYLYRNPFLSATRKVVSCHRCLSTAFSQYVATAGLSPLLRLKCAFQLRELRKFEFEMYRSMDRVLTLTPTDRYTLLNFVPDLRVSVVPPGMDFESIKQPHHEEETEPIIMMSGYFGDKTNTDAALWFTDNVWSELAEFHPDLHLHIVGAKPGEELKRLETMDPRIVVTGEVEDMRPLLAKARVFIVPVRLGSGLRIKIIEAMAARLPVVSTALGVAGIAAQNGVNCFVADTPELFKNSIEWLLNDPSLRDTMGRRAQNLVHSRYDIRANVQELERVLEEVIAL